MPQTMWTWGVAVDWSNDGSFATANDDISASVIDISITSGMTDDTTLVASTGTLTVTLKNADMRFTKNYAAGIYFGKMLPGLPVRVQVTHLGNTYTIFRGYTADFSVTPGANAERQATITAVDGIERLQAYEQLNLPLQTNVRSDLLAAAIVNAAYLAPAASGTVTIAAGNAANNDTVTFTYTINSVVTTIIFTFKTTLTPAANEVKIGTANTDTALNLAAAMNNATGSATLYATGTRELLVATASASGGVVTVTSTLRGTIGNGYTLAEAGANITVSGATLTGGLDYPTGLTSYEAGKSVFDYAADGWQGSDTNAMSALQDTVNSEQGMFFSQLDGTLTFWNRDEIFKRVTTASSVGLSNSFQGASGGALLADIYNRVEVKYMPRSPLATGIVAQATSVTQVPGQSGVERWNGTVALPGGGNVVLKLPAVDPTTALPMGIVSLITPLVPTTDWTASDDRTGTGNYTGDPSLTFSLVQNADSVEVSIKNTALGPLYVQTLKVRGVGIVKYNPVTIVREDVTNQPTRGRRILGLTLPFGFSGIENYADGLAQYWLGRYKDPDYRIKALTFDNEFQIAATSLFSLTIGAIVSVTEVQAQISASKHMIIGFDISLSVERRSTITLNLKKVDDLTYWILGDATYGVLGVTTRLSI